MKTEQRLCDACGAAATKSPTYPYSETFHVGPDVGNIALCAEHWLTSVNENRRRILARRAAHSSAVERATARGEAAPTPGCNLCLGIGARCGACYALTQSPQVVAEVDPRTLPVGAVFHHVGSCDMRLRVTEAGESCVCVKSGVTFVITSRTPAILVSLPEAAQEVELGSLAVGTLFRFASCEKGVNDGTHEVIAQRERFTDVHTEGIGRSLGWDNQRRVLRVQAPSSAVDPEPVKLKSLLSEFANIDPNCFACGNACESRCAVPVGGQHYGICKGCQTLHEAGHREAIAKRIRARLTPQPADSKPPPCATKDCPNGALYGSALCTKCRWPGASGENNSRVLELEILLAEQVRRGGQDCVSARSLIERADRVRREAAAEEAVNRENRNTRSIVYGQHNRWLGEQGQEGRTGIASLRLERPLIAWKRRK